MAGDSERPVQDLTYARVARVITRAAPEPGIVAADRQAELLALARQRAMDPGVFDECPPYFWSAEISSNRWDAYQTRMDATTLQNYVADCQAGVAFLRNHDTGRDPFGHSLDAAFVGSTAGDAPEGAARVLAEFFTIQTPERAGYLADMRAGVVRDVSVGFYGGRWECSICGRDMLQWSGPDACWHLLGVTYTPSDESGAPMGEPQVARATIQNAHLAEVSAVYDGATPGAMLQKARALSAEGVLTPAERGLIEVRYRLPGGQRLVLPDQTRRQFPTDWSRVLAPPAVRQTTPTTEATRMDPITDGVTATLPTGLLARVTGRVAVAEGETPEPAELVQRLVDVHDALRTQVESLTRERETLAGEATLGRQFREELVEAALTAGVRGMGEAFDRGRYERLFTGNLLSVQELRDLTALWEGAAKERLKGGRLTTDRAEAPPPDETAPGVKATVPDYVYTG